MLLLGGLYCTHWDVDPSRKVRPCFCRHLIVLKEEVGVHGEVPGKHANPPRRTEDPQLRVPTGSRGFVKSQRRKLFARIGNPFSTKDAHDEFAIDAVIGDNLERCRGMV